MSTITSPRPSTPSLQTPTSSRRTSYDTTRAISPARAPQPHQRRGNRAALRDYYGLKAAASLPPEVTVGSALKDEADIKESELDKEGFDAEAYVKKALETEDLEGVLRLEGRLLGGEWCS